MTFYFYDLETSSASPKTGRIMQFAGQRTNEKCELIGEPDNILVKLADDVLPEPDAVLVHGVTPQKTLEEGMSEADFVAYFQDSVATPDTVFVGYNNIRFDDEFMRKACYRTFHDPYQWHWKDGRSRWDMLDPIRMMRALRPEGLKWPMLKDKPSVKLELMAKENGILHENAHDALSDVLALIDLSKKFQQAQPKLFHYLLDMRDKKQVAKLVEADEAFVYTSGRYGGDHEKTTVVKSVFTHPRRKGAAVVYDLRHDPEPWFSKTPEELAKHWKPVWGDTETERLPVKLLQYNKCPAVADIRVLDQKSQERIAVSMDEIAANGKKLADNSDFIKKLEAALDIVEDEQQVRFKLDDATVDDQLYDGFWTPADHSEMLSVRMEDPDQFAQKVQKVKNARLREMMPLYKARNYQSKLSDEERVVWEDFRRKSLYGGGKKSAFTRFSERFSELSKTRTDKNDQYLLTELQLYVESILPEPEDE